MQNSHGIFLGLSKSKPAWSQDKVYPDFCNTNWPGVFLLHLDGMLVHHRVIWASIKFASTWKERDTVQVIEVPCPRTHLITWLALWADKMELQCILPALDYPPRPARRISWKPYNKSFINQACLVKMAGYWPCSFIVSLWTSTLSSSIKHAKKIAWPMSSHLNLTLGQ